MALKKRMLVNIVGIDQINFVGRNGEQVRKMKYTMLTPENEMVYGYTDEPKEEWSDREIDTAQFVESKAVETWWQGRVWEGQTVWRLA